MKHTTFQAVFHCTGEHHLQHLSVWRPQIVNSSTHRTILDPLRCFRAMPPFHALHIYKVSYLLFSGDIKLLTRVFCVSIITTTSSLYSTITFCVKFHMNWPFLSATPCKISNSVGLHTSLDFHRTKNYKRPNIPILCLTSAAAVVERLSSTGLFGL